MVISSIPGVLDPAVYVDGYVPHGEEVGGDFNQLITKTNEVIVDVNANTGNLVIADAAITVNEDNITDLDGRVIVLEGLTSENAIVFDDSPESLSFAAAAVYEVIVIGAGANTVVLPTDGVLDPLVRNKIVIIATEAAGGSVEIAGSGSWGDDSEDSFTLPLAVTESVTVIATQKAASTVRWNIVAGKAYSDLIE